MAEIAFIGTGIMGFQMARRLAEAGHTLTAWNRTRGKAERLAAFGASVTETPVEAAADAEIVIGMLADGPTSEAVWFGRGTVAAMRPGALLIDMASIPVETARDHAGRCAQAGIGYVDAPVSGGEKGATEGTLAIMAGGAEEDFERAKSVFEAMGRPTLVGPAGSGALAKLCNQLIVANTIGTVAEALLLAECGGADAAAVRQALMGGFADSAILRNHGERMLVGNFKPGGPAKYQLKDVRTATGLARTLQLELPVTQLIETMFVDLVEHGGADLDHSALFIELRRRNGLAAE